MTEYWLAFLLYLLGVLFVMLLLEPAEDRGAGGLMRLAFFWPFATLWMIFMELIGPPDHE